MTSSIMEEREREQAEAGGDRDGTKREKRKTLRLVGKDETGFKTMSVTFDFT